MKNMISWIRNRALEVKARPLHLQTDLNSADQMALVSGKLPPPTSSVPQEPNPFATPAPYSQPSTPFGAPPSSSDNPFGSFPPPQKPGPSPVNNSNPFDSNPFLPPPSTPFNSNPFG